jgi:amino acid adenylation domain-containing protein
MVLKPNEARARAQRIVAPHNRSCDRTMQKTVVPWVRTGFKPFQRSELEQSVTSRFENVVAWAGRRIAVKTETHELTYDGLNRAANCVALALLKLRGAVSEPVALLLGPDERAVSTVLGVLKTGKFYVPLDPSYPRERLSFILEDCASRILIADSQYLSLARELAPTGCTVVDVCDLDDGSCRENPGLVVLPDALAAVFYTSASTGRPKGVMQSHRLVLHRAMVDTNGLRISREDRLSMLSSPSYSATLRHLFGALLNGATLCPFNIADQGLTKLAPWLRRESVTIYYSVPTVFREFVAGLSGDADFSSLRVVHLGGESVTANDFEKFKKYCPSQCVFVNSLGSNETGTVALYVANKSTQLSDDSVPLGYEVDGKHIAIVNDQGQQLGPNEVGQLIVRSEFLSPGYWNQAELTAASFRSDPAWPEQRIFCTGDLGSLSSDGCLIYRGRKDFRAKIHGIRVEVEEIDRALRQNPVIDEVVTVARDDQSGGHRLIAYVVPKRDARITVSGLRRDLSTKLPAHMLPSAFVLLGALPRTPNGKIDRQALPSPGQSRPPMDAEFAAPEDRLEEELAQLCESTLGIQPIGVRDNLFDLGIDSLSMLTLTMEIERVFGNHLPPGRLFVTPTIAELAATLRSGDCPDSWSSLLPIQAVGDKPPFFWLHGDGSTIVLSRYLGPNQPFYALDHQSQDGRPATYTDVESIAAYYLREIRKVQPNGPYFVGGYSFGGVVALELAQQLTRKGDPVGLLALLDPPSLVDRDSSPSHRGGYANEPTTKRQRHSMSQHAQHLATLTVQEQLAYIRPRVTQRAASLFRTEAAKKSAQRLVISASLGLGRRLPVFVRSRYILDTYASALPRYVPRPYQGRAILFRGEGRDYRHEADWEQLLEGDLEVHVVNGSHTEIRERPQVRVWADKLRGALARAQGDLASSAQATPDAGNRQSRSPH